ncbi:MAG: HINT domain-containing protein, partial [Armatimonadota bacterium]|nr:HINT domain-containing protein [Armatimonadota bacterium]
VADGVVGDAFSQGTELALGWRCSFSPGELVTSGLTGGIAGGIGKWLKGGCFVAGTMVATEHGFKRIEDIRKGDLVWTRNPRNGKVELKPVTATMIRQVHAVVTVQLADTSGKVVQTIIATNEHPFFVKGKGWVGAAHLGIGTEIVTRAGPRLVVKSVTPHRRPAGYSVYNFTVGQDHSYFVGEAQGGVGVYNAACMKDLYKYLIEDANATGTTLKQLPGKIYEDLMNGDWEIDVNRARVEIDEVLHYYRQNGMSKADLAKAKKILTDMDLIKRI